MSIASVSNNTYTPPPAWLTPSTGAITPFPASGGTSGSGGSTQSITSQLAGGGVSIPQISSDLQSILLNGQNADPSGQQISAAAQTDSTQTASTDSDDPSSTTDPTGASSGNVQHHHHHHHHPESGASGDAPGGSGDPSVAQALQAYGQTASADLGTATSGDL